jgi:SAM-dependent methyltransferase
MMGLREYHQKYVESSKLHVENVMKYGPMVPFGHPEPRPEQLERIKFIASHVDGLVLDVGCDSGYILMRCGGGVGLDISLLRVKAAKHWYPRLSLVHAVAEHLPFKKEAFDTVVLAELLEHVLDPKAVLMEAFRVLKPTGRLVVTVPDEIHGKSHMNPEHLRKFTEGGLRNLLNTCFDVEVLDYVVGEYPAFCIVCRKGEILW